jgi:hypothetical protein
MKALLQRNILLSVLVIAGCLYSQYDYSGTTLPVHPFARVSQGIALPFVEGIRQEYSPYWDIGAGLSYEYLTVGISVRSHFLQTKSDTVLANGLEIASEGHTAVMVGHIEGKADVSKIRFAASIDIGMIWFHEFDHLRRHWSRSKLPIVGLGLDFRVPMCDKLSINLGGGYMAAFEGFEVDAKAYNSVHGNIGLVYDGGVGF